CCPCCRRADGPGGRSPREPLTQWIVNGALNEPICTWYPPVSTRGRSVASMSPGVTASVETWNDRCTTFDCPGLSATRVNATSRCGGTTTSLTGCATYTGTTWVPAREPVLDTVTVTS